MNSPVQMLSHSEVLLEIGPRTERAAGSLKERSDQGYVCVRFTESTGCTELYVPLRSGASDFPGRDIDCGSSAIRMAGKLNLDYAVVRCHTETNLATLSGR